MPIIKSAIKANRQTKTKTKRNSIIKGKYNELVKSFKLALAAKDQKVASELISKLYKASDIISKKNIFHRNKSARKKSQFAKALNTAFATK